MQHDDQTHVVVKLLPVKLTGFPRFHQIGPQVLLQFVGFWKPCSSQPRWKVTLVYVFSLAFTQLLRQDVLVGRATDRFRRFPTLAYVAEKKWQMDANGIIQYFLHD